MCPSVLETLYHISLLHTRSRSAVIAKSADDTSDCEGSLRAVHREMQTSCTLEAFQPHVQTTRSIKLLVFRSTCQESDS